MLDICNDNYFMKSNPKIEDNKCLRDPQVQGYYRVYDHFVVKNKKTHAIIVLPTGERVIIVTGCINALRSRVLGTLVNMIHALLRVIRV